MPTISLVLKDGPVRAALRAASVQLRDMTPLYKLIGEKAVAIIKSHFRDSRSPDGKKWADLKYPRAQSRDYGGRYAESQGRANWRESGARSRERGVKQVWAQAAKGPKGYGKPLVMTGKLRDSITFRPYSNGVIIGTADIRAPVHHFGHKFKPRVIVPVRREALWWPGAAYPVTKVNHPGSKVPARPFMGIGSREQEPLARFIGLQVSRIVRREGA